MSSPPWTRTRLCQGGACGAAGPASAAASGLGRPGRRTPGHTAGHADQDGSFATQPGTAPAVFLADRLSSSRAPRLGVPRTSLRGWLRDAWPSYMRVAMGCTPRGRISMYPPMLPGRRRRPGNEADQEKHPQRLSRDYESLPWLTALVDFSGFLVVLVGSFAGLFLLGTVLTHRTWWPFAVIVAVLVGTHACLRAIRYGRWRTRQPGTGDHRRRTRAS